MLKISQEEFENCIKDLIDKKITKVKLAKKLNTDTRTLNNEIYKISNKELLEQYIKKYPYKPKENRNINYEALIIELLKDEKDVLKIQEKYSIAERTYRRNVKKLETTNNRLYLIYKKYIKRQQLTNEELDYISSLKQETVCFSDSIEDRKAELMEFFMRYDELLKSGLAKERVYEVLKESPKSIKRKSDELNRIIEKEKMNNSKKEQKKYRESLKVEEVNMKTLKRDIEETQKDSIEEEIFK